MTSSKKRCPSMGRKGAAIAGVCAVAAVAACVALAVCLTIGTEPRSDPAPKPAFSTAGDLLEYLLQLGSIPRKDGLHVTWYHAANRKSEMEDALKSEVMVLEADINIEGNMTPNETTKPIMAHPPAIYSDNSFQEWLDAVLNSSRKGIKLDFKSIKAVGPALEILLKKSQEVDINRPVWLNADILEGPNVLVNVSLNASTFLSLIQEKYPNCTLSPGWTTLYSPLFPKQTYTRAMIQKMHDLIGELPQKVTFPVRAIMVRLAWPHFSWLLNQSERYSLTLWQGKTDPVTVEDLLFIRDNSRAEQIYYDIYDPVLSQFKEMALKSTRKRAYYPGGDLLEYFHPSNGDGLSIEWYAMEHNESKTSTSSMLTDRSGMIVLDVAVQDGISGNLIPVASTGTPLEQCLETIYRSQNPWGIFLNVTEPDALHPTLELLSTVYAKNLLWSPVWVSLAVSYRSFDTPGYMHGEDFLRAINTIFPHVTIAPRWPREVLTDGYTDLLIEDMLTLCKGLWQHVSFQLEAVLLSKSWLPTAKLLEASPSYTVTVQHSSSEGSDWDGFPGLQSISTQAQKRVYYTKAIQKCFHGRCLTT
ncbi:protein FAM151A isoform X1 [Alligator sinensis]|uniref:Protein FAM151A n=2 Tax=Alligator sinensis TaxID=38654 RepID=A0A1U7RTY3_ALLSI|nr:protein FAM151A isoform X1 [Alligator sinensis]